MLQRLRGLFPFTITAFLLIILSASALRAEVLQSAEEKELQAFAREYTVKMAPLEREANLAEWNAYLTGTKKDYEKMAELSLKRDLLNSSRRDYRKLIRLRDSGKINDPLLARELTLLINEFGPKQIEPGLLKKINDKEAEAQRVFNTYRGIIKGKAVSERDIYDILRTSNDRALRKQAWEAQKGVGPKVAPLLIDLVKLRNKAAHSLGFANYYVMKISFNDQSVDELAGIFNKLYETTEKPFTHYKGKMDEVLAARFGVKQQELRPWDYPNPFFQDSSGTFAKNLDRFFKGKNLPVIATAFYRSAGLPLGDILSRSDLYEKPGKSQHAFCYSIDRGLDIRILLNMRPDEESCGTLLHELGHGVYDLYTRKDMPWLIREPSHTFTTEASAMMFERLTKNPSWLVKMLKAPASEVEALKEGLAMDLALNQLVFCRWTEVMFNFEQELYRDPGQDLNKLWWDTVEKYQHLVRPEGRTAPDWASKVHFASAPVYYHNYMLGELMASQMMHAIGTGVLKRKDWSSMDFVDIPEAGVWLRENIYGPGSHYRWNDLLIRATGETLNPQYFAEQFITESTQ
ncbi:MAG: M2 family metallopeptidase [Candidatus Eremiobacteraeota bacterium]|nr:M2 family metallopeptidase [Candidatus Eremiobacteraeota bacterium]